MTDLFEYAQALRDRGMASASSGQPDWNKLAYEAIESIARRQATVHVDDVLLAVTARPRHHNAWGAVWVRAVRNGLIERTDDSRPCMTDATKHAHRYPVYRSLVHATPE